MVPDGENIKAGGSAPRPDRIEREKREQMEALGRVRGMLASKRPTRRMRRRLSASLSWARGILQCSASDRGSSE